VVLSEALANAILRGNQEALDKWVDVRAELLADMIRVYVTDEGPGFDPAAIPEAIRPDQITKPAAAVSSSSGNWWTPSSSTNKGTPSA
jgi:serine/threonine-protein kinase RsbW